MRVFISTAVSFVVAFIGALPVLAADQTATAADASSSIVAKVGEAETATETLEFTIPEELKGYRPFNQSDQKAIENVAFDIEEGLIIGVLGPSGAGKSTLLSITGRYMANDTGGMILSGHPGHDLSILWSRKLRDVRVFDAEERRFISLRTVMATHTSLEDLTKSVAESMKSVGGGDEAVKQIEDAFAQMRKQIDELVMQFPEGAERDAKRLEYYTQFGIPLPDRPTLSDGQRQRLNIARALSSRPTLLIADEPVGGLDAIAAVELEKVIQEIRAELPGSRPGTAGWVSGMVLLSDLTEEIAGNRMPLYTVAGWVDRTRRVPRQIHDLELGQEFVFEEGDAFSVEWNAYVPPEMQGDYREFAEAAKDN